MIGDQTAACTSSKLKPCGPSAKSLPGTIQHQQQKIKAILTLIDSLEEQLLLNGLPEQLDYVLLLSKALLTIAGSSRAAASPRDPTCCSAGENHAGLLRRPLSQGAEGAAGLRAVQLHRAGRGAAARRLDHVLLGA